MKKQYVGLEILWLKDAEGKDVILASGDGVLEDVGDAGDFWFDDLE